MAKRADRDWASFKQYLIDDLRPLRPRASLASARRLWWIAFALSNGACLALGLWKCGLRGRAARGSIGVELALLWLAALTASQAALSGSEPGRRRAPAYAAASLMAMALWVGGRFLGVWSGVSLAGLDAGGVACAIETVLLASLLGGLVAFALRQGAPVRPGWVAVSGAVAAAGLAAFMLRIGCLSEEPGHLLAFHALPLVPLIMAGRWGFGKIIKW